MVRGARKEGAGRRRAVLAGAIALVLVAAADLATSSHVSFVGYLVLAPLVAATAARPREVAVLVLAALAVGLPLGASNHIFLAGRHLLGLGLIVAGGAVAIALSRVLADLAARRARDFAAHERLALLDRSTRLIAAPLEATTRLDELTRLPIPDLGDLCMVDLLEDDGRVSGAVVSARRPEDAEALRDLRRRFPIDPAGDHPVAVALRTGDPQLRRALSDAELAIYAAAPEHLELMRRLRYGSAVVVPLVARGRTLGVLSLLRFGSDRPFDEGDLALVTDLAARSALSVDNGRLFDELRATEGRLDAILSVMADAVTVQDRDGRLVYINDAAARLLGLDGSEDLSGAVAQSLLERYDLFDDQGAPLSTDRLPGRVVLRGEEPQPTLVRRFDQKTGDDRWALVKASAVRDEHGEPLLAVNVIEDVTEERRAAEAAAILADASGVLASMPEFEKALDRLARGLVPRVADRCAIELAGENDELELVAAAGADAAPAPEGERVLRSGNAELRPDGSALVAPMLVGDRGIGVITLECPGGPRRLMESERELAQELGRRVGMAVENARVNRERMRVATALQRSLLPPRLPAIPGLSIATRFRAAGATNQVGGDFYDVFEVDGGWIVVIGDVTGKGPDAAAITSLARYTMRTAARYEPIPTEILRRLNEALLAEAAEPRPLCTAICMRIDAATGDQPLRATVACAGHPPPYRVDRVGRIDELCAAGPLLGAFEEADWRLDAVDLFEGDALVLYTDGVTDTRGAAERFGAERLREALVGAAGADADGLAAAVDDALLRFQEGPQRDDVALLVLHAAPPQPVDGAPLVAEPARRLTA